MELNEMISEAYDCAIEKGFMSCFPVTAAELLAGVHSEVSEAYEVMRDPELGGTQCHEFAEELADICIRTFTIAGAYGIDLNTAIEDKLEKNRLRGFLHGKVF